MTLGAISQPLNLGSVLIDLNSSSERNREDHNRSKRRRRRRDHMVFFKDAHL